MFICECCGEQQKAGVPAQKKVLETRVVSYTDAPRNEDGSMKQGTEIVKEISACPDCME